MSTSSPKIAQVVCTYPPYHGGMGKVAFEYTERLRARGYNVHVFTSQMENPLLAKEGAGGGRDPEYIHRIPAILSIGNAGVMPSLFNRLKGFDLVHVHYPFFGGAEPVIVRKALRHDQGLVMTYHMDAVATGFRGAIFEAHKQVLFPWIANRCDRILVSSKDYYESSALAKLDSVKDRVEIHPFGVDLKTFSPGVEEDLQMQLGISKTVPVLLFVGGLDRAHHFKGLPVLLESLKDLSQPFHLVVVGSGDLKATYEVLVRMHHLETRVTFVGSVSNEDLPRYYALADVFVFPSVRRAEAFGLVALEAAACGVPTIASSLPGVRSVVLDGDTGLLVTPEDVGALRGAIELLLTRTDLREQLGRSARLHAEAHFSWEPLMTQLEATYKSVLEQQSKREY
ncbi:MAG: glycosyltransferase family 4 protein [Candidatus Uhrbacteria bacterium]|nr:glycosyltransferase family 4 protein [Candidatus Uhrbacteria bacterium]